MNSQRSLAVLALLLWLGLCGLAYWLAADRGQDCFDMMREWQLGSALVSNTVIKCMVEARGWRDLALLAAIAGPLAAILIWLVRQSASPPAR